MHLLSVYMEPILHLSCPHNCEDFLSWLPPGLAFQILSYLDPCVGAVKCAIAGLIWQMIPNYGWTCAGNSISWVNNGLTTCDDFRVDKWQLSPASQLKQLKAHTLPDGRVQVLFIQISTHTPLVIYVYSGNWFLLSATDCFLIGWKGDVL